MQLKHSLTAVLVFFIQMLKFHEGTLWTLKEARKGFFLVAIVFVKPRKIPKKDIS